MEPIFLTYDIVGNILALQPHFRGMTAKDVADIDEGWAIFKDAHPYNLDEYCHTVHFFSEEAKLMFLLKYI